VARTTSTTSTASTASTTSTTSTHFRRTIVDESAHHPPHHPAPPAHPGDAGDAELPAGLDTIPVVDPAVDEHIRALLAAEPDPGLMPTAVAERIGAALALEARLRVDPGPLRPGAPDDAVTAGPHDNHDAVLTFATHAERRRRVHVAAAVAAAAVVVAGVGSALHVTTSPSGTALFGDGFTSTPTAGTAATPGSSAAPASPRATVPDLHVQLSTTAYGADRFAAQSRDLLDHPGTPLTDLAAESPAVGPIGTQVGLMSCLAGLGAADPAPDAVAADLATYAGEPAVVVVVTRDGASIAWAVRRSCSATDPGVLHPATPVP
jgi:hypothetical protein